MADLVGRTLGQYEILEEIGRGGMANVYRAVQPSIGREVAVKILPTHFLQDQTFLERFNREVQVIARLQHPHILPVYDYGEQEGRPYIVMAYLTGGSLADHIQQADNGMPLDEVVRLVSQIAEGLDFAHKEGIIHRDFKPRNVLLDRNGNAYLSDFGIAKVTEITAQLTGTGIVGTPAYMAPEMAQPGGVSPLVDIYALGVTIYQMLTGLLPYEADTPLGVLMAHASRPIPDVRESRPDLPVYVQMVVGRAMAKDSMARYSTAGELAKDLRAAVTAKAPPSPVVPPTEPHPTVPDTLPATPRPPELRTVQQAPVMPTQPDLTPPPAQVQPASPPYSAAPPAGVPPQQYAPSPAYPQPGYPTAPPARRRGISAWVWILAGLFVIACLGMAGAVVLFAPEYLPFEIAFLATETETPRPTATELPTSTPTSKVEPTSTEAPPPTLEPTATVIPTDTPVPTDTPIPPGLPGGGMVTSNSQWTPMIREFDGVEMALVPIGCFMMGSNTGDNDEKPVHEQCFNEPFWIDVYEVTNQQYGSSGRSTGNNRPRELINWFDAFAHCEKRGGRLPTDKEWEYAARGPDSLVYPWGNEFVAGNVVYEGNSGGQIHDVGSKPGGVSWVGAYDMSGNVWEWVSSIWMPYPYDPDDGRENYFNRSSMRVLRGGSFLDGQYLIRTTPRDTTSPSNTWNDTGFRCARDY